MPFPSTQRVIYQENPLVEVVCQLRFPPILKIDSELPAQFQDSIRKEYPNYTESSVIPSGKEQLINSNDPNILINQLIKQNLVKEYKFSSSDEVWKVTLSRTFIALTTSNYERWESFRDRLNFIFTKFCDYYSPSYFSRIGLRYIDIIDRQKLNITDINWNELVQDYILGIISTEEGKKTKVFDTKYELELADEQSVVAIRTSFAKSDEAENPENCFVIDSDFFNTNKIPTSEVFEKLEFFHDRATRLIRWAIKPSLHNAMKPINIE